MAYKFKAGDIIKLKSGSRTMTVSGNATTHTANGSVIIPDRYECFWVDGSKPQKAVFHQDSIKLV